MNILRHTEKFSKINEIIVVLFEHCNLNCVFCTQDHNSTLGWDSIEDKFPTIQSVYENQKKFGKLDALHINFMGGELLSDQVPDEVFESYIRLLNKTKTWIETLGIPYKLNFITNLVFENTNRIDNFLEKVPYLEFHTSYDPAGRFDKASKVIFEKNILYYKNKIKTTIITLTKPTMQKLTEDNDETFKFLYNNFDIDFDYYNIVSDGSRMDKDNWLDVELIKALKPTDVQLRDFFKFLLDKYPNSMPVRDFLMYQKKTKQCNDTGTILPDNSFGRCVFKIENNLEFSNVKDDIESKWFDSYNCLECNYFSQCGFACFTATSGTGFRTQDECWLKEVYKYKESKWN